MRPPPSRTSTVLPSVSRAPHNRRPAPSDRPDDTAPDDAAPDDAAPDDAAPDEDEDEHEDEDEDEEWGGCGWLSGIALQGLGGCASPEPPEPRKRTQDHAE
ncbi:hypothetical protein [Streptomyces canus]|uniref:hypothetical protein n=1 Tax=Streptomyces canus TaxID=58343 RepID=UPI00216B5E97|nr:hypothetical protein [Streptomyces canus]